jgi:hypothetical protein
MSTFKKEIEHAIEELDLDEDQRHILCERLVKSISSRTMQLNVSVENFSTDLTQEVTQTITNRAIIEMAKLIYANKLFVSEYNPVEKTLVISIQLSRF